MAPGTPHDPVTVSFWDLSPRVMALAIVLTFFPVLVCPTEILFALKVLAAFGYLKIAPNAVFQNKNRLRIYEIISANPGISFPQLPKIIGLKRGPMRYHLMILCTKRKITAVPNQATFSYFENSSRFTEFEKTMIRHLQNVTAQKILEILIPSPSVSRKDIAGILGVAAIGYLAYEPPVGRRHHHDPEKRAGRPVCTYDWCVGLFPGVSSAGGGSDGQMGSLSSQNPGQVTYGILGTIE